MKLVILHLLVGGLLAVAGCYTPTPDNPLTLQVCPGHQDAEENFIQYQAYLGAIESLTSLDWRIVEADSSQFTLRARRCDEQNRANCYEVEAKSNEVGTLSLSIPTRTDQVQLPTHWIVEIERKYQKISCDLIVVLEKKIRGKGLEDAILSKPEEEKTDEFADDSAPVTIPEETEASEPVSEGGDDLLD